LPTTTSCSEGGAGLGWEGSGRNAGEWAILKLTLSALDTAFRALCFDYGARLMVRLEEKQ